MKMRNFLCLSLLWVASLFAKNVPTVSFCIRTLTAGDSEKTFLERTSEIEFDSKWKWGDSLTCGYAYWKHQLDLKLTGKWSGFNEFDDDESDRCSECAKNKKIAFPKLSRLYLDKKRIQKSHYKKKIPALWKISANCACPSYKTPELSTELNVVITGACPAESPFIYEKESVAALSLSSSETDLADGACYVVDANVDDDEEDDESSFVTWENDVIVGDTVYRTMDTSYDENMLEYKRMIKFVKGKQVDEYYELPKMDEGVFPCYKENGFKRGSLKSHPSNYAGKIPLNMIESPIGTDEALGCYEVGGKRFMTFGTNVPELLYDRFFWRDFCYVWNKDSTETVPLESNFYSCRGQSGSPKGCKAARHGIDIVVDENLSYRQWSREGLEMYASLESVKSVDDYLREEYNNQRDIRKVIFPRNVPASIYMSLGNDAAQKTVGMNFYRADKKVKFVKYPRNHFKTLKDAMDACKAFPFAEMSNP